MYKLTCIWWSNLRPVNPFPVYVHTCTTASCCSPSTSYCLLRDRLLVKFKFLSFSPTRPHSTMTILNLSTNRANRWNLLSTLVVTVSVLVCSLNSLCHGMPTPDEETYSREVSEMLMQFECKLSYSNSYRPSHPVCPTRGGDRANKLAVRQGIDWLAGSTRTTAVVYFSGRQSVSALQQHLPVPGHRRYEPNELLCAAGQTQLGADQFAADAAETAERGRQMRRRRRWCCTLVGLAGTTTSWPLIMAVIMQTTRRCS